MGITFHRFLARSFTMGALPLAVFNANLALGQSIEIEEEQVTVLGTRVEDGRSAIDAAVPVDIIGKSELQSQGSTDIIDVLTNVVPSFNANREPISDAASMVRPANLRGMPSDNTLVLVNGKRRHRGAVIGEFVSGVNRGAQGVDLNPLFGMALKQVGVLRDGAAAQYGSDAIAGVMNFQLADDPNARRFQMRSGQYYEGDGTIIEFAGLLGTHLGANGFATVAFEVKDTQATSRGVQDGGAQALADAGVPDVADPVVVWGTPEITNDYKLIFNSALEIGDSREIYAFGNFATRSVDGSFFYRNPQGRSGVYVSGDDLLVADLTPNDANTCPSIDLSGVDNVLQEQAYIDGVANNPNCFAFNEMFPGGFTPRFGGKVTDASFVAGLRGDFEFGMNYDFSVTAGRSRINYEIANTVNASYGPATPTDFDLGSQEQFERIINLDFSYPIDIGLFSDLNFAFGLQHHSEQFDIVAGQTESWAPGGFEDQGFSIGANGFQGFPSDVAGEFTRDSQAAYIDLETNITEKLLVAAAIRYENFDDFGSSVDGKVALRFDFNDYFALRSAVSTGFKAPTIGQSNLRRASTSFENGALREALVLPPTNEVSLALGGEQLTPEESRNYSLGAVVNTGDLTLTLDYFNIVVEDRISLTRINIDDTLRVSLLNQGLSDAANIDEVQFFVNDFDTETSGLDIVATYTLENRFGTADLILAYNQTDTEVTDLGVTISEATAEELEGFQPDQRITFTTIQTAGQWTFMLRANYYGSTLENLFNDTTLPVETDPITLVDAEVSRAIGLNADIAFGAKNIFDTYPDEWQVGDSTGRSPGFLGAIYPLNHPAGFNGGFYYLRASIEF